MSLCHEVSTAWIYAGVRNQKTGGLSLSWEGHFPSISVIWINRGRRQYQKRGMFTKIPRIEAGHFDPELGKVGKDVIKEEVR